MPKTPNGNAPRLRKSPREDPKVQAKDDSKERPQGRGKGSLQGQRRVQGKTSRSRPRKTPRKCSKAKEEKTPTQLDSTKGSFSKSLRPIELGKQQQTLLDQKPKTHPHSYTAAMTFPKA